jgi:formate dehydrogenase
MTNIICVLYDDPVSGYPPSYARASVPTIEQYHGRQNSKVRSQRASSRVDLGPAHTVS